MTKTLCIALFCSFAPLAAHGAAQDCQGSSEACSKPAKKATPFLAEVAEAEKDPALRQGRPREPELKPAPAVSAAPAAEAPAAPPAPAPKETLLKPGWLLLMFALLTGLYYYLKESRKRGKRA